MRLAIPAGQLVAGLAAFGFLVLAGLSLDLTPAHSYSSGAPVGFSGPEQYCNACHGSPDTNPVNSGDGAVSITAPDTFTPGETVPITVTVTSTSPSPNRKQGFELSARDGTLAHVGAFVVDGTTVQYAQGDARWVTHTASSNTQETWTFAWVAPSEGAPEAVTLYVAGNAADGDFAPDADDKVYAAQHVLTQASDCEQSLSATLDNTSPAPGQTITFTVTVTNSAGSPAPLDLWLDATGPASRRLRLASGTLPAGATVTRSVRLRIPGNAPSGTYNLDLNIGDFAADDVCDTVSFTLNVQPARVGAAAGATDFEVLDDFFAAEATLAGQAVVVSPNPFVGQAAIRFEVAEAADVRLSVYDVLGRQVAVLVDGRQEAGSHSAVFNGSDLAAGTYVYRLVVGSDVQTGRMTLAY